MDGVSTTERRNRLATRHRLTAEHRASDVRSAVDSVLALHASDPVTVYLSVAARLCEPTVEGIQPVLHDHTSLIRHHAMRRTLWVMAPDVARLAHVSSTLKVAAAERKRLIARMTSHSGISEPESWIEEGAATVADHLASVGSTTTREIGEAFPHLTEPIGFPGARKDELNELAAHTRLLLLLGFEGRIVRGRPIGSWIASQYRWESAADVFESIDELDVATAAARLLNLWLERFGPATETDLRWWTGWTAAQTRRALADCGARPVELEDLGPGWIADGDIDSVQPPSPWVALLPGLDPTPMGWKEREWYLPPDVGARVTDRNGNIGPTVWSDGLVVGGWVQRSDGDIAIELMRDLDDRHRELLDTEVVRLKAFVGDTRFKVRFPAPNQKDLYA